MYTINLQKKSQKLGAIKSKFHFSSATTISGAKLSLSNDVSFVKNRHLVPEILRFCCRPPPPVVSNTVKPIFHCNAKYLASGVGVGLCPDARILRWRYQYAGILEPTQSFKFALPPTPNPDASQWNIGCVGSLALGLCVGHVHFIFFVLISFALGSRRKHSFQWNMGLIADYRVLVRDC